MGIQQELYFPWRPHEKTLFIMCNKRDAQWPDMLESVVSNINSTVNAATGTTPHFILTGRQPVTGLPVMKTEAPQDPRHYSFKVGCLLLAVKKSVGLASAEADLHMKARFKTQESPRKW